MNRTYLYLNVSIKLSTAHCFIKCLHTMEPKYTVMLVDLKQLIEPGKICDEIIDVQRLTIIGCLHERNDDSDGN